MIVRSVALVTALCAFLTLMSAAALATGGGKALLYGGAGQGRVIFDGRTHASAGLVCNDCHTKLFETRKKALITMEDHSKEKACFACHNGKRAFSDCGSCHRQITTASAPAPAKSGLTYEGASTIATGIIPEAAKLFQRKTGIVFGAIGDAGADRGFKAALEGKATFGGLARELTAQEKAQVSWTVIGYDVMGVFVHPANPVSSLTMEQLREVFTGRAANWKALGGADAAIVLVTEKLTGGRATVRAFKDMVLKGDAYGKTMEFEDAPDCLVEVSRNPAAITMSSMSFAIPGIKAVALGRAAPVKEKVQSGEYPLKRPLVIVTKREPAGPVKEFIDLLLSKEGQEIVGRKFVPAR